MITQYMNKYILFLSHDSNLMHTVMGFLWVSLWPRHIKSTCRWRHSTKTLAPASTLFSFAGNVHPQRSSDNPSFSMHLCICLLTLLAHIYSLTYALFNLCFVIFMVTTEFFKSRPVMWHICSLLEVDFTLMHALECLLSMIVKGDFFDPI